MPATHSKFATGDRVKVTSSMSKLEKEFCACGAYKFFSFDGGVKDTLNRTMIVVETNDKGKYAKVAGAPNSNYEYEWTLLPLSCLTLAKPIGGQSAQNAVNVSDPSTPPLKILHFKKEEPGPIYDLSKSLLSPVKKESAIVSHTPKLVCYHFIHGTCKYGSNCNKLHLDPPQFSFPNSDKVLPAVIAAAAYAYDKFYSQPYKPKPNSCCADDWVYHVDFEPMHGVNRTNHSLPNALCKGLLVPALCKAFKFFDPLNDAELLTAMMVAMVFEVVGRESEIGFNDCTATYLKYHYTSVQKYIEYAQGFGWYSRRCVEALKYMFTEKQTSPGEMVVREIFEWAHDLPLIRCYPKDKIMERHARLCKKLGQKVGMTLVLLAETALYRTGDRIMFSMTGLRPRDYYVANLFRACATSPNACIKAIMDSTAKTMQVPAAPKATVPSTSAPSSMKTLGSSNFLKCYSDTAAPTKYYQLAGAIDDQVMAMAKKLGISEEEARKFYEALQENAVEEGGGELYTATTIKYVGERVWTSSEQLGDLEFAAIVNRLIREDDPSVMSAVCTFVRALNEHCVVRKKGVKQPGVTYRGITMPHDELSFYREGKSYRAPMFIATSARRNEANKFMWRNNGKQGQEPTLFIFHFNPSRPCYHVNLIDRTDGSVSDEAEWLFSPYSTFKVRKIVIVKDPCVDLVLGKVVHHEIHLDVQSDNSEHSLGLELSRWA